MYLDSLCHPDALLLRNFLEYSKIVIVGRLSSDSHCYKFLVFIRSGDGKRKNNDG
jgi:hypothetical protein